MNNFQTVVGIEVHTVVNSQAKMFSNSKSCHTDPVNTNICGLDLAMPGLLPSINETVVKKAICLAQALHMKIDHNIIFDRKNYFYRDLPKGFQITQQFNPIGTDGYIEIEVNGNKKKIRVERIHMEEDTAKQMNVGGKVLLDYNRCGMPLIEIVSKPDISSPEEAMAYLTQLKRILNFNDVSDAKMEEGSLRADVNISINPFGAKEYGTRFEIKNINSISNVGKAIAFEADRHAKALLLGETLTPETRRYDDATGTTVYMRAKGDVDYHFMRETNILPIAIDDKYIAEALKAAPYNLEDVVNKLTNLKIDNKIIGQLLDDYPLFKVFDNVLNAVNDPQLAQTWILVELIGLLKKDNKTIEKVSSNKIKEIINMINLIKEGRINSKQAKVVIAEIYSTDQTTTSIIEQHHFKQITDPAEIEKLLTGIIAKNENMVKQYTERPERVEKMMIGLLMKETGGQANPVVSAEVLRKLLKK